MMKLFFPLYHFISINLYSTKILADSHIKILVIEIYKKKKEISMRVENLREKGERKNLFKKNECNTQKHQNTPLI
jgi:hypothetical protein